MSREYLETQLAVYTPKRTSDLKDGASDHVGEVHLWQHVGNIEDQIFGAHGGKHPYAGQGRWSNFPGCKLPFAWVPECDLTFVTE